MVLSRCITVLFTCHLFTCIFLTGLLTPATVFISSYSLFMSSVIKNSGALPRLALPAFRWRGYKYLTSFALVVLFLMSGIVLLFALILLVRLPYLSLSEKPNHENSALFLVAFVLIIQALDQSYQKVHPKRQNTLSLCNKKSPEGAFTFILYLRLIVRCKYW